MKQPIPQRKQLAMGKSPQVSSGQGISPSNLKKGGKVKSGRKC